METDRVQSPSRPETGQGGISVPPQIGPLAVFGPFFGEDVMPPEPGKQWLEIATFDDELYGDEVAILVNRTGEPSAEQWAYAQLLAAAPDLLAALQLLLPMVDSWMDPEWSIDELRIAGSPRHLAVADARAAIARATGGQS